MCRCLASRVSCAAHSRTCATLPGAEASASVYAVWIESMTTTSGDSVPMVAMIASSCTSASSDTGALTRPSRCARSATCSTDSSPVTYSAFLAAPMAAIACSSSVDLPIPGSPPSRMTPPGTSPPPSTRSNSSNPVGNRGLLFASTLPRGRTALALPVSVWNRVGGGAATVSTSVFHAPQCGHWPCHFGLWPPHSVQL